MQAVGGMPFFLTQSLADATNHTMKGNVVWKLKLPGLPARESGPLFPGGCPHQGPALDPLLRGLPPDSGVKRCFEASLRPPPSLAGLWKRIAPL